MSISLKEIVNRQYNDTIKEPMSFEYIIKGLEGPHGEKEELRVWFERVFAEDYGLDVTKPVYRVFTIIKNVVYEGIFQMPKSGMTLEMVVATGLNHLHFIFQQEASYKEMLSYTIANITKDI